MDYFSWPDDGISRYVCKRGGLAVWGDGPRLCDTPAYAQSFVTEEEAERHLDELVEKQKLNREQAHIECIAFDEVFDLRLESRKADSTSLIVLKENGRWFLDAWYKGQGIACAEFSEEEAEHIVAILTSFDEKMRRMEKTGKST